MRIMYRLRLYEPYVFSAFKSEAFLGSIGVLASDRVNYMILTVKRNKTISYL